MPPHSRVRRSSLFSCHFHAIRARRRAAVASKSANLHIEGSKVTCIGNFLIRIKNDCFHTVCPYEKPNTLIRQYGISSYPVQQAYSSPLPSLGRRQDILEHSRNPRCFHACRRHFHVFTDTARIQNSLERLIRPNYFLPFFTSC